MFLGDILKGKQQKLDFLLLFPRNVNLNEKNHEKGSFGDSKTAKFHFAIKAFF